MKVHSKINDEDADIIKSIAHTKGLAEIDYEKCYRLYKIGSKGSSIEAFEPKYVAHGEVSLIGLSKFVWIHIANLTSWFKTSPIIHCKKQEDGFIIETENSFYKLKEDE
jgi:hypothetical protein